jgi:hypothetical protein
LGGPFYAGWDLRRVSRSVLPPLTARPCVCISVTKCRYSGVSGRGGRRGPPLYVEPCLKCASVDSTCSLLFISLLFTKQCDRIDTLSGLRAGRRPDDVADVARPTVGRSAPRGPRRGARAHPSAARPLRATHGTRGHSPRPPQRACMFMPRAARVRPGPESQSCNLAS